jgi:outer membrane protein
MTRLRAGAFAALATIAAAVPVASHAETKIAVVNVRRLLEESPQAKLALQTLQTEFATREREMVQIQKDLRAKDEKFQRDGATMTENDRRNTERDLREGQRDLQRKQQEFAEDYNLRRNEEIGKVQRSLLQEVQTYAKGANYDLVVGDGVLYAAEAMDITPQVLSALQARQKTGATAPKPAAPAPKPAAATPAPAPAPAAPKP